MNAMKKLASLKWLNDRFARCRCRPELLSDYKKIAPKVTSLIRRSGLKIVGKAFHQFDRGYTCVWLLSQSHVSLHSWPEYGFVTASIEVCGFRSDDPKKIEALHRGLKALFKPAKSSAKRSAFKVR